MFSQPCLPDGITFTSQAQIDSFQINYPGCTMIEGDVAVYGSDIYSFNGLNSVTSIGGIFEVQLNGQFSFAGLDNLDSIYGGFILAYCENIENLNGLNNLLFVGGELDITGNYNLTSLEGLSNLHSINGYRFILDNNDRLKSLAGLENLTTIEGRLIISGNDSLTDLTALQNLTNIKNNFAIEWNPMLSDLSGLENINLDSVYYFRISNNQNLTQCEISNICSYLSNPPGYVIIFRNGDGCNNPPQIADYCGFTMPCLPVGNYYFYSQHEIDDFTIDYINCTRLNGFTSISGDSIFNLQGLNIVDTINGTVRFSGTKLSDFSGLENIKYISDRLEVLSCDSLKNFNGFNNLVSIGDYLLMQYSKSVKNLEGLDKLKRVGGDITIKENNSLTNLNGLQKLDTIYGNLIIFKNDVLYDLSGLDSVIEIHGDLIINGNYELYSIEGLENLNNINGSLRISGTQITNINPLSNLNSINGYLYLSINHNLTNIDPLVNINSLGSFLVIRYNEALNDISGLLNLNTINSGNIDITNNASLTSLYGLDNIAGSSIIDLNIYENPLLSECEVQSICDYLVNPNGTIDIHDNAIGCDSQEQIEDACSVGIVNLNCNQNTTIYPNPANNNLYFNREEDYGEIEVLIYNQLGQTVFNKIITTNKIDISNLEHGIYFIELKSDNSLSRHKLIRN